jgi:hypothetical protein
MVCISHLVKSYTTANAFYVSALRLTLNMTVPANMFLGMVLDIGIMSSKPESTKSKEDMK